MSERDEPQWLAVRLAGQSIWHVWLTRQGPRLVPDGAEVFDGGFTDEGDCARWCERQNAPRLGICIGEPNSAGSPEGEPYASYELRLGTPTLYPHLDPAKIWKQ